MEEKMLKIGEFSKISRVSVRMLRHYDDIGLLKPVETDSFTGYRYYEVDQLPTVGRITSLKDMGFKLADIIRILDIYDDRSALEAYFETRREELEAISKETAYQMKLLDTAINRLRKEDDMSYNVSIKTIPERYAATVHMTIPHYEDEGMVWQIMTEETAHLNMADTEHVKFRTLPAIKVASCTIKGSYDQMNDCYAAIIGWINENGFKCSGSMFNIYLVSPHETQNPDEFVTEVCYPVE